MSERLSVIKELQKQASEIKKLKDLRRQKRPIVIEFCGSPKSGKTSCINSLELFLKRNGFSVKTIQERASVCPVIDKLSPMFNIWTSCSSLVGMIGTLESADKSIDVLILDRGIFDALCWFDWLVKKGRMDEKQKEIMEQFLLMEDLVKSIDIVFAFTVEPQVSIEREYTNLLTDKLGTIMNPNTLAEYRDSVLTQCEYKKQYFHKVFPIDTTNRNQNHIGKQVTENTLSALKDLLMEKIGYFHSNNTLIAKLSPGICVPFEKVKPFLPKMQFGLRDAVEKNDQSLQPLPIAVITNRKRDRVLIVKKQKKAVSPSSPEKEKYLAYVGGHVRYEDTTEITAKEIISICRKTLRREVKEELGISVALDDIVPYVVYADDMIKSKKHLAICFIVEQDEEVKLHIDSEELVQNRGTSKSGQYMSINEIPKIANDFESWSKIILHDIFNVNLEKNLQTSF